MTNSTKVPNKLISEKSPYLLQHAYNPVNWYPWGEEAFDKAKQENKPVFLSIGYSTCHWCHVMEKESFVDEEVAELLNQNFISIKVDREERPDVDSIYMSVCQALTGSGGWPLTILMTPSKMPFYAATYLPKYQRYGTVGLLSLLAEVTSLWKTDQNQLLASGEKISEQIKKHLEAYETPCQPNKAMFYLAWEEYRRSFDETYGGFGSAPKFPAPHNLLFLLQYAALEGEKDALSMVEKTLVQIYRGGIFDHIGGGFSRYSTDQKWLVPHFEKMLYDNALLAMTYLEAYRTTNNSLYSHVAEKTLQYIQKELTHTDGGFYCSQDADSEGVEGKYYVFTPEEIETVLGKQDSLSFCQWFGITSQGNFEGKNIPNLLENKDYSHTPSSITALCQKLYDYRKTRTKLHTDDKILTSWNALAITAFADGYRILGKEEYLTTAKNAVQFIETHLQNPDGTLFIRWREGNRAHQGQLDDYAFYANALLELYEACFEISYLQKAIATAQHMISLFFDQASGGFYLYSKEGEQLLSRPKELYDGAMPSGNSVAAQVLIRLAQLTGEPLWQEYAHKHLAFLAGNIGQYPTAHSFALLAMTQALYPSEQLLCTCSGQMPVKELHHYAAQAKLPLTILVKTSENQTALEDAAPFTKNYPLPQEGNAYYLCQGNTCSAPVTDLNVLLS